MLDPEMERREVPNTSSIASDYRASEHDSPMSSDMESELTPELPSEDSGEDISWNLG